MRAALLRNEHESVGAARLWFRSDWAKQALMEAYEVQMKRKKASDGSLNIDAGCTGPSDVAVLAITHSRNVESRVPRPGHEGGETSEKQVPALSYDALTATIGTSL